METTSPSPLGADSGSRPEPEKKRLRNLPQYRELSDEDFERAMQARRKPSEVDPRAIMDFSRKMPAQLRPWFKSQVEQIIGSIKSDITPELMRRRVEHYVFLDYLASKMLLAMDDMDPGWIGDRDTKAIATLESRIDDMAVQLGITPKERRLAGVKTDEAVSEMLKRSRKSADAARETKDEKIRMAESHYGGKELPQSEEGGGDGEADEP